MWIDSWKSSCVLCKDMWSEFHRSDESIDCCKRSNKIENIDKPLRPVTKKQDFFHLLLLHHLRHLHHLCHLHHLRHLHLLLFLCENSALVVVLHHSANSVALAEWATLSWCCNPSWLHHNAMQCNGIQCNAIPRNAMGYNVKQCNAIQWDPMGYNVIQCTSSWLQSNLVQFNAVHHLLIATPMKLH